MATTNFWLRNADRYFVATPDEDDDPIWWHEDQMINLQGVAEHICFDHCSSDDWRKDIERRANRNMRDYYASVLRCNYEADYTDEYEWTWRVELIPLMRSGYYSAAVLDYYIRLCSPDGDQAEDEELTFGTISEMVRNFIDYRAAYDEHIPPEHGTTLMVQIQSLIQQAKDKFYEFAEESGLDEYVCAEVFSNGEAIYTNLSEIKRRKAA